MAATERLIGDSAALQDGGAGLCFTVLQPGGEQPAFAIRFKGVVHAYVNACGHVPARLDWLPGAFFDDSGLYLICSVHGALYAPESGRCLTGRCQGRGLKPLPVVERDGRIYLTET